ncbi:hypothetical protein DFQ01_109131 [Paenibacillus cellulosilyticus]|uniref:NACHT domain-containing protein n=1 Tax=Paenibacillus cellulosilyticus TaxID=375489 RepID=A0A2V2YUA2_9BACL|nr:hypothetical protein [Paenibacillus cellulosilyticus]PWW02506.1 hypothetical protein DFQ01_109131 [Paenibacillus cellulosilyticus]QKS47208.1 hypothetical protein HUB94_22470 [Paenibacillus cellulosilyticus]
MDAEVIKVGVEIFERNIERIVTGVFKLSRDGLNRGEVNSGKAFQEYLTNAYSKYSKVKTLLYNKEAEFLKKFYISQSLCFKENVIASDRIDNILRIGKCLLITGAGGMGKTSFLKNMFLNVFSESDRIPLFVELRDINGTEMSLLDTIYKSLFKLGFNLTQDYLHRALELGKFILFFDGFDEVDLNKRDKMKSELIDLTDLYNENYYIVSSRKSTEFSGWTNFRELDINGLTLAQAKMMIEKLEYDKQTKEAFLIALDENLYEDHLSFASNPLLLTIMFLTYNQYAEIPEKKYEFYEAAFEVLYSKHDATKGFKREKYTNLSSTEFKKILNYVSLSSYLDNAIEFNSTTLIEYISFAKNIEELTFDEDGYKEDLVKSVCIFIEEGFSYKYSHRSFQEYFTAKCIASLDDDSRMGILEKIFEEKPHSIEQDMVFVTLFDMNRAILERSLFIKLLDNLFSRIEAPTKEEKLYNFNQLHFSSFELDYGLMDEEGVEDESNAIAFSFTVEGLKYRMLFDFLINNYSKIIKLPEKGEYHREAVDVSIIKQYHESTEEEIQMGCFKVTLDTAKSIPELFEIVLRRSRHLSWQLECIEQIYEKIKSSIENSKSLRNLLLEKKNK